MGRNPPVRLACVRHAASVRSEPGSNSQVHRTHRSPHAPRKARTAHGHARRTTPTRTASPSAAPDATHTPHAKTARGPGPKDAADISLPNITDKTVRELGPKTYRVVHCIATATIQEAGSEEPSLRWAGDSLPLLLFQDGRHRSGMCELHTSSRCTPGPQPPSPLQNRTPHPP